MESNHPIPQDVTGFQFKLIGAMTVKQFLYLAVPSVVAWVFYSAPFLPWFVKYPIILFLAIGAVVMAFLPIEGRPADVMLKHFFEALFAPNQFIYQKTGQKLAFTTISTQSVQKRPAVNPLAQAEQIKTRQLQALLQSSQHENLMDDRESSFMQKVSSLMPPPPVVNQTASTGGKGILPFHLPQIFSRPLPSKPVLSNFKMVDLGNQPEPENKPIPVDQSKKDETEKVTPIVASNPAPIMVLHQTPEPKTTNLPIEQPSIIPNTPITQSTPIPTVSTSTTPVASPYPKPEPLTQGVNQTTLNYDEQLKKLQSEKERMEKELATLRKQQEQTPVSSPVPVPQTHVVDTPVVTPPTSVSLVNQTTAPTSTQSTPAHPMQPVTPVVATPTPTPTTPIMPKTPAGYEPPHVAKIPAAMAKNMGLPSIPDSPNLITGIVRDPRGNILPNILVEVKDKEGNPVRAFKTNQLGQFASATPLLNGTYTINFEDLTGQHKFDVIEIIAKGTVLLPIGVISHDAREELRKALFS